MSKLTMHFENLYRHLIADEELLRLLAYAPKDIVTNTPDPLEVEEDILYYGDDPEKIADMWEIIDHHILKTSKSADLEEARINRIYVYTGKTKPDLNNKRLVKQELVIDIFSHYKYEVDARMERITDRLNRILIHSRATGMGQLEYRDGYDFVAPKEYRAYRHIFETTRSKQ